METETELLKFIGEVTRRYGEDIGQETALKLLEFKAHKEAKKWSRRVGWLIAKRLSRVMGQSWREKVDAVGAQGDSGLAYGSFSTNDLESRVTCKEILAHPESKRILAYLDGKEHFTRQRLQQLRVKLAAKLHQNRIKVILACVKRERKFRQLQRVKVRTSIKRAYCSL